MAAHGETPAPWPSQGPGASAWSDPTSLQGLASGGLGALTIALFFLSIDWLNGRPLWTPAALGSQLFTGAPLEPSAPIPLGLVLGYSLLHLAAFAAIGVMSVHLIHTVTRLPRSRWRIAALFWLELFVGLQAIFLTVGSLLSTSMLYEFGGGLVAEANALAAATMAGYLTRAAAPRKLRSA